MMDAVPAWRDDRGDFRPERFLTDDGAALAPAPAGFVPFGIGTHFCLGSNLALAEMSAMLAALCDVIADGAALEVADAPTRKWAEFPILAPSDGLPATVKPAGAAAAGAAGAAAAVEEASAALRSR
jgi:cytochrome P450